MSNTKHDFRIETLGTPSIPSPIKLSERLDDYIANYVSEDHRIIYDIETSAAKRPKALDPKELLEPAGPRKQVYFDGPKVKAAIVTCGGLCPGLNDVIRSIVMSLWYHYGVRRITGIRYGYRGFIPEFRIPDMELTPETVAEIHQKGGTILGSSRGHGERTEELVDSLERMNINLLFAVGGDGTQRGAYNITKELRRRGLKIGVVGIPKTIDNDLSFIEKSFGFETAVSVAVNAVAGAHVEAHDAINGIGLVKVMGRESGFIAAHTALAINDVNFVLIPEVPFDLDGDNGLLAHLERRLERRGHAVILVAEGAGASLMPTSETTDSSGNRKFGDIGLYLQRRLNEHFGQKGIETNLKYIDPSYLIRSAPANPNDSLYCARLGGNAVHAAMCGKTGMLVSQVNGHFVHVPIAMAVAQRNRINPESALWRDVIDATGQPSLMKN
ncbi:MAG: ATP-dependent 6-phosphofructokinase [Chitinivibrionales bacterium]|nr:ATP-dependent 6-phosphofructokinase [Chitinivibrionales bacterium]MBD3357962.1 ATP-dependent 6-phosphofructokinase [Chitinivibrionales bacterium]